jgi:hypothetical protein
MHTWGGETMGGGFDPNLIHDHYSFPHTSGHGHEMTPAIVGPCTAPPDRH